MNREQAKELLPIIEAYANGEVIQYKAASGKWRTLGDDYYKFDSSPKKYRIKPKPRECWVTIYNGDTISTAHTTKTSALECLGADRDNWEAVKFREVTDETDM